MNPIQIERQMRIHAGAAALQSLLRRLAEQGDADLAAAHDRGDIEGHDARNYRAMAVMVEAAVTRGLADQDAGRREGFLRALTSLLALNADGCTVDDGWAPIGESAEAYAEDA